IPTARPVSEPPMTIARFIQFCPSNGADVVLASARRSQNPQYRVNEQFFFLGTVGDDCSLQRDLRNPPNAGRRGPALRCLHFADEGWAIQIFHARDRCDSELTGYAEQSSR